MKRRTFVKAIGAVAFGATAGCKNTAVNVGGDGPGAVAGPGATALRGDPFSAVQSATFDLIPIADNFSIALDSGARTVTCLDENGVTRWELNGGPDSVIAGPVAALAWGNEIAIVDNSPGRVLVFDYDGRHRATLPEGDILLSPADAALAEEGSIIVADLGGHALVRIERGGGRSADCRRIRRRQRCIQRAERGGT